MTPERWQQIKTVLCNALELESASLRENYLREACGDDVELRHEVNSLLEPVADKVDAFADKLRDTVVRRVCNERIGERIGAYRIVNEIGRGGMGAVYLAERADGQFEKQVAIKILKRGTDTDEIVKRFQAERQILARLEHPNIARLIDGGTTDDGLPYFIMEYVTGAPVTQFVLEQPAALRERLELFLKICGAVEFAHSNAVVHRDLKPTNILVTANGEPKLLDFGIAKLISPNEASEDLTGLDHRRLTASYASPEQAAGRSITFRSDIYALGTVLYQILTGARPHEFSSFNPSLEEVSRVLAERRPKSPSELVSDPVWRRQLQGELDRITLVALHRDPKDRYQSVRDFADDIRKFLNGSVQPSRHRSPVPILAGAISIAIALLAFYLIYERQNRPREAEAAAIPNKSLAVLPFQNRGAEKDDAAFASGIQEEILSELAKVADLKVIGHASVKQFDPSQPRDLPQIGRNLGVAHVLEGSVQQVGTNVRVAAQLTDTRNGAQIWAEHYDREMSDVFAIESDVAQAIVRQLQARLSAGEKAELEDRPTRDLLAYDLYLRARRIVDSYLELEDPKTSLTKAIELLNSATARDPNFALAFACAARAHDLLYFLELDLGAGRVLEAEKAVKMALQLRPDLGETHLAMADHHFRCYRDYERARQELAVARPKLPNSVPFFLLSGYIERRQGLWHEATRSFSKAVELDPANLNAINLLADQYVLLRRFNEAANTYQRAISAGLDSPVIRIRIAWAGFGGNGDIGALEHALQNAPKRLDVAGGTTPWRILVAMVHQDYNSAASALADSPRAEFQNVDYSFYYPRSWYEAIIARARGDQPSAKVAFARTRQALAERLKLRPVDGRTLGALGETDAGLGERELAIQEGKQAVDLMPMTRDAYDGALVLQNLAQIYVWTGEKTLAMDLIDQLLTVPGYLSYGFLRVDPAWDPLRNEVRFGSLLTKAKEAEPFKNPSQSSH